MSLGEAEVRRGPGRPRREAEAIRPPVRSSSEDAQRAAERAAAIRANSVSADDGTDAFYIPPEIIPDGWSYEWKRAETMGKQDHQHMLHVARRGWEPVPQERHPDIMVQNQGMILMERPLEITRDSFVNNQVLARNQIAVKEEQLGSGEGLAEGTKLSGRETFTKRTYEHQPIPD